MRLEIPGRLPGLNEYIAAERTNKHLAAHMKRTEGEKVLWYINSQLRGKKATEPVVLRYTWIEKDRRRDKDNISSFGRKVIQDALVKARVLRNDGWDNISGFTDEFQVDKKRPRIVVEIVEAK